MAEKPTTLLPLAELAEGSASAALMNNDVTSAICPAPQPHQEVQEVQREGRAGIAGISVAIQQAMIAQRYEQQYGEHAGLMAALQAALVMQEKLPTAVEEDASLEKGLLLQRPVPSHER